MTLRLATGPVSWGIDFAGTPGNAPWSQVLDGAAAAGFRGLELGPLGYLPRDVGPELEARGLRLTAGFVFEPLHDDARLQVTSRVARATATTVAELGGRFLVIIDRVSPARDRVGEAARAPRLDGRRREKLLRAVRTVADIARAEGLRPLLHPHAGSYLEFEDEFAPLIEEIGLCLDTGHFAYAGVDPVAAYRRWADRIPYIHLKDLDPQRRGGGFWHAVGRGVFRPLGEGSVDIAALMAAMAERGFDGWAVIEQDRTPGGDPLPELVASRKLVEGLT
jgi:inosose dehydratase